MPRLRVRPDFTIFLLFFGAAMADALRHREWAMVGLFVGLALLFLFADRRVRQVARPSG